MFAACRRCTRDSVKVLDDNTIEDCSHGTCLSDRRQVRQETAMPFHQFVINVIFH